MQSHDLKDVKLVENRLFTREGKRYLYLRYENKLPNGDVTGATTEVDLEMGIKGYADYCNDVYKFGLTPNPITTSGISFNKSTWEVFYKESPVKEMTLKDVENELGYKVKIVSN